MYVEFVSVSVRVCLFDLLFLTVRSAQIRNFSNHLPAAALPPPLLSSITCNSCHNLLLLLLLLLLILWLFISDGRVCARVCAIRYGSTFCFLLFSSFIASLALSLVHGPTTKYSLNYATTVVSSRQRASVRVSVCLLVGTGADRKITTADRCSASACLHFSIFAPTPTRTHTPLVYRVCVFWQDLR